MITLRYSNADGGDRGTFKLPLKTEGKLKRYKEFILISIVQFQNLHGMPEREER